MLIWFAAGSVAVVWTVFRSPAVDYRMVMLGSILPSFEGLFVSGPLHTLLAPTIVLIVVMAATVGRRMARRRYLGIPIGMYLHLVLGGAWSDSEVFWWPLTGLAFEGGTGPIIERGLWSVVLELIGIGIAAWLFNRFGLSDPERRRLFVTTGQLDRKYLAATEGGGRT